jgi:hypothetical protein
VRPLRRFVTLVAVALIALGGAESPPDEEWLPIPNDDDDEGVTGCTGEGSSSTGLTRPPDDFPNDSFHLDVFLGRPS